MSTKLPTEKPERPVFGASLEKPQESTNFGAILAIVLLIATLVVGVIAYKVISSPTPPTGTQQIK